MDDTATLEYVGPDRCGSPWLTQKEAAAYARVGHERIVQLIATGRLRAYWAPGSDPRSRHRAKLVNKADIDELLRADAVEVREVSRALYGAA